MIVDKVIISGADGFVGSYTTECFLQHGIEVVALDLPTSPKHLRPHRGLTYIPFDIRRTDELKSVIHADEFDTFIHFAWAGSSGPSRFDHGLQMQNALTTVECMKAAKNLGCRRFVCAGSIMEYEVEAAIHAQGSRPGLAYIYGMGKHVAHGMCKAIAVDIGIDLLWPMITNAYGVGELSPRFINTTLRKIINGDSLEFTSATQNYDFVYVTDVAEAFYRIALNGKPFCEYMIGSGKARSLKEFILEMQQTVAPESTPIFGEIPFTGVNMPIERFSISALQNDCGFCPQIDFAQGVSMTMEWLKQQ